MLPDELKEQSPCTDCSETDNCTSACDELNEWYKLVEEFDGYYPCCFNCENYAALYAAHFDDDMKFSHGALTDAGLCSKIGYFLVYSDQTPCEDFKRLIWHEKAHQRLS